MTKKIYVISFFVLLFSFVLTNTADANHSWGNYHWARTSNPFTLKLGDNVSSIWDGHLNQASVDWTTSSVLDTSIVAGNGGKNCSATLGRVEVCNKKYGNNGWLGIASISVNGNHITKGVAKMNDTYFNKPKYNTPSWKQLVMCQEVAHAFGLDHQDENFDNPNLDTCMDYTSSPAGNESPNAHDYEQLETIYAHLDSITTLNATIFGKIMSVLAKDNDTENQSEWGKAIHQDANGRDSVFEKDLGRGNKVITHVFWAE